MRGTLAGGGEARVIAAEQLRQNVMARALGLGHLHKRRADQVRDDDHLQQVRLLYQRQAIVLGQFYNGLGDAPDKRLAGQNHQPGNAAGITFVHQA